MCIGDHAIKTWSSTQSVVALSTGEAEMYAINKTAATGMGGQSILKDLGVTLELRVFTDATTGKSLVTRRGLGKVRHIAVNELWLQSHVQNKTVTMVKIKNKFNPSDMMTKYLTKMEMQQIMEHIEHKYEEGRPAAAPKSVKKTDTINVVRLDKELVQEMHSQRGSNENCTSIAAASKNCESRVAAIENCTSTHFPAMMRI